MGVELDGLQDWVKSVAQSPDLLRQQLEVRARKHSETLAGLIRDYTLVDTGGTRASIVGFAETDGPEITGGARSNNPVATYMEFGTGPVGTAAGHPLESELHPVRTSEGWWWYSGEEGQRIKAQLHGGDPQDYSLFTYTKGMPPVAMFYHGMQDYEPEILKDFGGLVLEVLK